MRETDNRPRISIITPSYQQDRYLEQTIRSVLTQDYPHKEYIVIDGGSTDGSVDILRKYADRLAYWCSGKDDGQADAIARGFEKSTGEILCWLNSDDLFLPGALSAVAKYFAKHPEVEVVSGGGYFMDSGGRPWRRGWGAVSLGVATTHDRLRFHGMHGVLQQATFWRRSAYEAVGGIDRTLHFAMDLDLFIRLAKRRRFGRLPRLLACLRLHERSKTATMEDVRVREVKLIRERYGVSKHHPVVQRGLFERYRVPSLLRRLMLSVLYVLGRFPVRRFP